MATALLTTASTLQCPHGGSVSITSSNQHTQAGAALALATDTFSITGCPNQRPVGTGSVPSPCVKVQWLRTNTRCSVNGTPTLSQSSSGLCLAGDQVPQGSVSIVQTQPKASGD